MRALLAVAAVVALGMSSPSWATERKAVYEGRPRVIDGDTLAIGSDRLRIWGVDAPESDQHCRADGTVFPCGAQVTEALRAFIGGDPVRCRLIDWNPARLPHHSDRAVVQCAVRGVDLGDWLVSRGLAVPYFVTRYRNTGRLACQGGVGLWRGSFARPASFRQSGDYSRDLIGLAVSRDCRAAVSR